MQNIVEGIVIKVEQEIVVDVSCKEDLMDFLPEKDSIDFVQEFNCSHSEQAERPATHSIGALMRDFFLVDRSSQFFHCAGDD